MVKRVCPVCAHTYEADPMRLKHGRQTTCSRECSYELRRSKLSKQVKTTCAVCGQEIYRSPSQVKSEYSFCSPECHYKGRSTGLVKRVVKHPYNLSSETREKFSVLMKQRNKERFANGWTHSDETKAKLASATAEAIASGKFDRTSRLEDVVRKQLDILSITYEYQHLLRDSKTGRYVACIDFYLPEYNVALEVNGTFWHADPRVYDHQNLKPSQIRTLQKYEAKRAVLQESGIQLREVWEIDIKQDALRAVCQALQIESEGCNDYIN